MKTSKWVNAIVGTMLVGLIAYGTITNSPWATAQPPRDRQDSLRGPERSEHDRDFRPPAHPVMDALDADSDGELSADEITNAATALKKIDGDGDGKLSREEMRPESGGRGDRPAPGGPDQAGGRGDRPGPGGPDQAGRPGEGFPGVPGGGGGPGGPPRDDFANQLMSLDKNGDGKVSKDELPEPMQCIIEPDANEDGAIDKEEAEKLAEALERHHGSPSRGDTRGGRQGGPNDDRIQRPERPQRPSSE